MANIGIYIELKDNNIKKSNREALTLARKSGKDVHAVIFANDLTPFQEDLKGIVKIIQVKDEDLTYQPDFYAATMAKIIKDFNLNDFLGIYTAQGKDLFPRIAAKVNASLINDCIDIDFGQQTVTKPVYAGKLLQKAKVEDEFRLFTIRPNVFPVEAGQPDAQPEIVPLELVKDEERVKIKEIIESGTKKIDLVEAEIIVSGGRGMKEKDNFKILDELAAVLNAGVGASRAAVDSEYASPDMQVGQTGKVVNPKLYIACGISGAIQHFVGMKTSKIIVAINKDPEAPIFKKADYGIVADLFKAVPLLTEELKKVV
jgi:electron transfer flavoprotein alpha subunit